jgi:hypothetical protein
MKEEDSKSPGAKRRDEISLIRVEVSSVATTISEDHSRETPPSNGGVGDQNGDEWIDYGGSATVVYCALFSGMVKMIE